MRKACTSWPHNDLEVEGCREDVGENGADPPLPDLLDLNYIRVSLLAVHITGNIQQRDRT